MTILKILSAVIILTLSTSCVETVLVASATTGTLLMREKTFADTRHDAGIASKLAVNFIEKGLKSPNNSVDIMVNEGRVLLTGIIRDHKKARLASQLAWRIRGVKEVIDEIKLSEDKHLRPRDISNASVDYVLTAEIEGRLFFKRRISSVNYKITTVNGTVYLIGIAANERELRRVLSLISKVRGVKQIINHAILSDDIRRKG